MRFLLNPTDPAWRPPPSPPGVRDLHRGLDGYAPSPLVDGPGLADAWACHHVAVKTETDRWGLPSFKVIGTTWAVAHALRDHLPPSWRPGAGLSTLAGRLPPLTLVAASEGNHGEALAYVARLVGLACRVFVSTEAAPGVVERIAAHGAEVVVVRGTYDDAVAASASRPAPDELLVSDTSWPGYEDVPRAVAQGYATLLDEVEEQVSAGPGSRPDLVLVPLGVGALASAVIGHFAARPDPPRVVGVEPVAAACVMASLAADRLVALEGPLASRLSGLNCGTPSMVAWPALRAGLAGVVALDDDESATGARLAADHGLVVGPCGGATVAAADAVLSTTGLRAALDLPERPTALLLATDGPSTERTGTGTEEEQQR